MQSNLPRDPTSELGQQRRNGDVRVMSVLPPNSRHFAVDVQAHRRADVGLSGSGLCDGYAAARIEPFGLINLSMCRAHNSHASRISSL